jgi:hypothetical protein
MDERAVSRYYDLLQRGSKSGAFTISIPASAKAALASVIVQVPQIQVRMALRFVSLTFNVDDLGLTGFLTCNNMVARINAGNPTTTVRFIPALSSGQILGAAGNSLYFVEDYIIQGDDYAEFGGVASNPLSINFQSDISNSDVAAHNVSGKCVVLYKCGSDRPARSAGFGLREMIQQSACYYCGEQSTHFCSQCGHWLCGSAICIARAAGGEVVRRPVETVKTVTRAAASFFVPRPPTPRGFQ